MKLIPLTKGQFAIIDDADFELISAHKWHAQEGRKTFYADRKIIRSGKKTSESMHRKIMGDNCIGVFVDHIDGNGLNNTRGNLRTCSVSESNRNRRIQVNNSSGAKGVRAKRGKWVASIVVNMRQKSIMVNLRAFSLLTHSAL